MNVAVPPDLPDEVDARIPVFKTRRKAEDLPPLRPAAVSNRLEAAADQGRNAARAGWHAGFRWGVVATVGGLCLMLALMVGSAK